METESLLLFLALMLICAWLAYREERARHAREVLDLRNRPNDGAAMLSAMHAALQRIEKAAGMAESREPLPGLQAKPRKRKT